MSRGAVIGIFVLLFSSIKNDQAFKSLQFRRFKGYRFQSLVGYNLSPKPARSSLDCAGKCRLPECGNFVYISSNKTCHRYGLWDATFTIQSSVVSTSTPSYMETSYRENFILRMSTIHALVIPAGYSYHKVICVLMTRHLFFQRFCIQKQHLLLTGIQDVTNERKKPSALPPQHGRVAIVTGGTTGIGYYTIKTLCSLGMHVIIASRCKKHIQKAIDDIKKEQPDAVIEGFEVDLGSMKSVHKFAYEFKSRRLPLHILINNAAVMYVPYKKTEDGLERHIAVNYMGHFLLSILLLPVLNMSGTNQLFARIVNVSSSTHRVGNIDLSTFTSKGAKPSRYSPYASYSQSKLAMIMATYELARRLKAAKCFRVTVNALHPGVVDTNLHSNAVFPVPLIRYLISRFYLTPEQGADTVLHVALSPDLEKQSGGYYENCERATSSKLSNSMQLQQAIWHTTCSVLGIDPQQTELHRSFTE
ncbi:Hypothetical predicted protein [Octopus vulgaris]|uniref:Retinol dehydrogenase 12-like n=1 Tax=Octopus vulgaris TaxID=6645 RepID=A0AA36F526_OCTVU|nr:Hypothetical predicted protein [Octopus vulgaris]